MAGTENSVTHFLSLGSFIYVQLKPGLVAGGQCTAILCSRRWRGPVGYKDGHFPANWVNDPRTEVSLTGSASSLWLNGRIWSIRLSAFLVQGSKATPYQLVPCHAYFMENKRGIYFNILRMYSRTFGECLLWRLKSFDICCLNARPQFCVSFPQDLTVGSFIAKMRMKSSTVSYTFFTFLIKPWLSLSDFYSIKEIKCFGTS